MINIIEKITELKNSGQYNRALSAAKIYQKNNDSQELQGMIADLQQLVDLQIEKDIQEHRQYLERKAAAVNTVNRLSMAAAVAINTFLKSNPIQEKQTGEFTKKYQDKLNAVIAEVMPPYNTDGITYRFENRLFSDSFRFYIKICYPAKNSGCRYYENSQYYSETLVDSKPAIYPVDRTADFYLENEKALKAATAELRDLEHKVSTLKRISEE
jgi:hypothetical protein